MAVTSDPIYPVAGEEVTLSLSNAAGNSTVYEILSVPPKSTVAAALKIKPPTDDASDLQIGILQAAERKLAVSSFVPDVSGEYVVVGYDLRRRISSPAFPGDPAGEDSYELLASQTTTINVGAVIDLPVDTVYGDGADLRVQVNDSVVRACSLVNFRNEKSRVAALDAAVLSALGLVIGTAVGSLGTLLQAGANDLRAVYEAHRANTWFTGHYNGFLAAATPDALNKVVTTAGNSQEGAILLLNELRKLLVAHLTGSSSAPTTVGWHQHNNFFGTPTNYDDLKNLPLTPAARDIASATVLMVDLRWRVYDRHRRQSDVSAALYDNPPSHHSFADTTNTLTASKPLDDAVVAYLDALVVEDPSVAAGESEGRFDAEHLYGFGEPRPQGQQSSTATVAGAASAAPSPAPDSSGTGTYKCDAAIAALDWVYISADDTVAKANATDDTKPALGVVESKPDATHALVRWTGELAGFAGLTQGTDYFLAVVDGAMTDTPPNVAGNIVQPLGRARSATILVVRTTDNFTVI